MDGLRWLLLAFGVLLVVGVYFYGRRQKQESESSAQAPRRVEPVLEGADVVEPVLQHEPTMDAQAVEESPPVVDVSPELPQKIVTLRIVAQEKSAFQGDELVLSLRGIGMRHGNFGIFHRYDGNDEGRTVFSAASLVEPGSFDLQNIKEQQIPGISLFLVLPGPIDSVEGFDLMMTAARALTQTLGGELLDESGSSLSIQRERYLREEIIQYQHSGLVA